jgi:hypothetical protein
MKMSGMNPAETCIAGVASSRIVRKMVDKTATGAHYLITQGSVKKTTDDKSIYADR